MFSQARVGFLDFEIPRYAGHVLWPGRLRLKIAREADFLGLSCAT